MAKEAKEKKAKEKKPKAKKETTGEGRKGRISQFAGQKIYKLAKDNPRREGSHGHTSFALITNGMSYEKYLELGGRRQDLVFCVEKGHVEMRA